MVTSAKTRWSAARTREACWWAEPTLRLWGAAILVAIVAGCGINKSRLATEQLVVSDAVDKAVAGIDFSPLSGRKVFFDTQYLEGLNMGANGNVKYLISSLRQQMLAYDCRLQEKADTADYVVEGRVGVLANDGHEVTYGIPGSAALASASVFFSSPVTAPSMPELSLGRRNHQAGTAKIGIFAYDRLTREPVWQAGLKKGVSEFRDSWVLGLGPYQADPLAKRGSWGTKKANSSTSDPTQNPLAAYGGSITFERALQPSPPPKLEQNSVMPAAHQTDSPAPLTAPPQAIPLRKS
jgi:hypothetical protein